MVEVVASGDGPEGPWLAMELVEGGTLDSLLAQGLPLGDGLDLLAQVADALAAAHERGVVHRDLKPANVLVTRDSVAKVADWGIAKAFDDPGGLTKTGVLVGTPQFMAPEQLGSGGLGPPADLYALGVMLFTLAAGRLPFVGDDVAGVLRAQLQQPPPDLSRVRPTAPPQLCRLVAELLEKRPELRAGPAATVARRLRDLARSLRNPAAVPTLEVARTAAPTPRPRLQRTWTIAALTVALAVGAVAFDARRPVAPGPAPASPAPNRTAARAAALDEALDAIGRLDVAATLRSVREATPRGYDRSAGPLPAATEALRAALTRGGLGPRRLAVVADELPRRLAAEPLLSDELARGLRPLRHLEPLLAGYGFRSYPWPTVACGLGLRYRQHLEPSPLPAGWRSIPLHAVGHPEPPPGTPARTFEVAAPEVLRLRRATSADRVLHLYGGSQDDVVETLRLQTGPLRGDGEGWPPLAATLELAATGFLRDLSLVVTVAAGPPLEVLSPTPAGQPDIKWPSGNLRVALDLDPAFLHADGATVALTGRLLIPGAGVEAVKVHVPAELRILPRPAPPSPR